MKKIEGLLPLIDMIFLTMGTLLLLMTQMEMVRSVPVDFVKVGKTQTSSKKIEQPLFVAISRDGIFVEKQRVNTSELMDRIKGNEVILRADKNIPYGEVIQLVASLRKTAKSISLEVKSE